MDNKLITGIIGVVVVVALLGSALVPVIDSITDGGTSTETLSQEGAGWVRMVYDTAPNSYYAVNLAVSDDAYTATNNIQDGAEPDVQSGSDNSILYADSNLAVWGQEGSIIVLGTDADGADYFLQADDGVRVVRSEDKVEIFDVGGTDLYATFGVPSYAFIPVSTGGYGFFENGTEAALQENVPTPIVGAGFAGVYAYNDLIRFGGFGFQLQKDFTEDGKLAGAYWEQGAAPEVEPEIFDPSTITITPLDPGVISLDPEPDAAIMSVPTPTYTDGDWGYDLTTISGVQKAKIISYSGTGGGQITIPATVGGYEVDAVGKGTSNYTVFDTTITATDLIISNGITTISQTAFTGCSGFTGTLTIPSSVTTIGNYAFQNCTGFTGTLTIPSSVTTVGTSAFTGCTGFTGLNIQYGVTTISASMFQNCTGFTGTLTIPSSVTTISNNAFDGCLGFTGSLVIPSSVTTIKYNAFYNCKGFTGSLVIPSSVTTIEYNSFQNCTNVTGCIIASDATPGSNAFRMNAVTEVLDLSESVDYSTSRYGLPNAAAVSDSIGDAIGYISYSEIEIEVPGSGSLGGAAGLLYAIPVVIIAAMLVAGVGWFIGKRY